MSELSLYEMEMERADLLPARETLAIITGGTVSQINSATNTAVALSTNNVNVAGAGGNAGNVAAIAASVQANAVR